MYDWNDLFSRKRFVLVAGRDYACETESMATQIRIAASARQIPVTVVEGDDRVTVVVQPEAVKAAGG